MVLLSVVIYSCNNTRPYELVGAQGRKPFYPEVPTGMVYVPAGGFTMGLHDQDILNLDDARAKVVTISAFYMDQTEISNNEYRQFVEWVSIHFRVQFQYQISCAYFRFKIVCSMISQASCICASLITSGGAKRMISP